ncbi:DUF6207 family protein [Streptomyces sp. NPDC004533]|uniref:DUF6207 family protein n=1 Tax=Streptomyces sp. NPDC004533 TaxID=3154278 RepID=UPI0033BD3A55
MAVSLSLSRVLVAWAPVACSGATDYVGARKTTAPANRTTREPDEPGVRLRFFLDLRQAPDM